MPALWLYALVAVLIERNAQDPALLELALASCGEALVAGHCERGHEGAPPAALQARLTWDDALHAKVELLRAGERETVATRQVAFAEADALAERYRALGLIVASLALAHVPPPLPPSTPAAAPPRVEEGNRHALDLLAYGGPALERGELRAGGGLRASSRPLRALPWLGLSTSVRASYRPGEPRLVWAAWTLGLTGRLALTRALATEGRLEWVGQRLHARARDPLSGEVERGARLRQGGQLGLELTLRVARHAWLFAGGELALLRPRVTLRVAGQLVGRERALEPAALLGGRYGW